MIEELCVGDRVVVAGFRFREEADRVGTVVELYTGKLSHTGTAERFFAIQFDDTKTTERGFLQGTSRVTRMIVCMLGRR